MCRSPAMGGPHEHGEQRAHGKQMRRGVQARSGALLLTLSSRRGHRAKRCIVIMGRTCMGVQRVDS